MDNKTLIALSVKSGGENIRRCEWCNIWKPIGEIKDGGKWKFCGTVICNNCYINFWHMARDVTEALAEWANKRLARLMASASVEAAAGTPQSSQADS